MIESTEQSIIKCPSCGKEYDFNKEIAPNMFESVDEKYVVLEVDFPYAYCGACNVEMVLECD